MARPKTKSALVDGMSELVETIRSIESKLNLLIKSKYLFGPKRGPGRPVGSIRTTGSKQSSNQRGPGRPPGTVKKKPTRLLGTTKKSVGRPAASTTKSKKK